MAPIQMSARIEVGGVDQPYGLNEVGHQGLQHDEHVSLIYNRARHLHPGIGRFMQREPLGYIDGMSLYQYVRSNPIYWMDPSGYEALLPHDVNDPYWPRDPGGDPIPLPRPEDSDFWHDPPIDPFEPTPETGGIPPILLGPPFGGPKIPDPPPIEWEPPDPFESLLKIMEELPRAPQAIADLPYQPCKSIKGGKERKACCSSIAAGVEATQTFLHVRRLMKCIKLRNPGLIAACASASSASRAFNAYNNSKALQRCIGSCE